jgi:hypothetical protein
MDNYRETDPDRCAHEPERSRDPDPPPKRKSRRPVCRLTVSDRQLSLPLIAKPSSIR